MAQAPNATPPGELSDLQRRRLGRLFEAYDADQDGYVGQEDFERRAAGMIHTFGVDAEQQRPQALRNEVLQGWQRLQAAMDTDNDQRLSKEELLTFMANTIIGRPGAFVQLMLPTLQAVLDVVDTDRDGRIGLEEFVKWQGSARATEAEATQAFQQLDRDGDGSLTQDELLQALEEYFTSDDPEAGGNWLYPTSTGVERGDTEAS